jgi:Nucleoside-diphosphate-sugar epimerases
MRILLTGTSGYLGEAIARTLLKQEIDYVGVDIRGVNYTHQIGISYWEKEK